MSTNNDSDYCTGVMQEDFLKFRNIYNLLYIVKYLEVKGFYISNLLSNNGTTTNVHVYLTMTHRKRKTMKPGW